VVCVCVCGCVCVCVVWVCVCVCVCVYIFFIALYVSHFKYNTLIMGMIYYIEKRMYVKNL